MYYHFYYEDTMASFDNLVNSLFNNTSNSTTSTPIQGPLISDLARAQIANANPNTQQAIDTVQQAQDMQRYIGMDNHVQDYALNGIAAAADAVGSLGALGGEVGERAADATLGNVARGLRSLTSSDSQHRQELKANTGAWLQAKSQAQYQKDIANGKSQTEASLAKIGRDAVNFFNSNDLGMVTAESAGSLVGSFVGGGLLGKVASLGAKGIMAANAAKTIAGKAATYEKTIAELTQVRAEAQAAAQAGKISMDEAAATIQKIDSDVAKLSAQKEGILADQAALAEQQQAVMQAQDLNKARQGYIENQVDNEALSIPSKEVLDTEIKTLNNNFDRLVNYKNTNNKRLADTNYNITTTASQKPIQEAKYNTAQKQYAEAITKANEAEGKLTKTESDFDKFKQNIPEIEAKLNKQVEAKATKVGEEVGGVGINFAYGADAGADAVKSMHLENLSEADLQNSKEYKAKKQEYLNKGLSPEDASAKAIADIRGSIERTTRLGVGAWEAAVSKIMGTAKLEGKGIQGLLRTKPIHMAADTFKETAEEIGQGIGETVGGNISEKRIDNDKDLTEGLGESIAENAFGIPAGMAATKAGAVGIKGINSARKLATWGAAASVAAGQGIDKVADAFKSSHSEKAVNKIVNPTGNVEKENKIFNKLDDSIKEVLKRDDTTDTNVKDILSDIDDKELQEQVLGKDTTNQHQQLYALHESAKKDASILNAEDSSEEAKQAAYQRMTTKLAALHEVAIALNNKTAKSDLKYNELNYAFKKKAREIIDTSPEYRKRLINEINNADLSEEDKQAVLKENTFADLTIDSQIEDNIKNNKDISNEVEALKKVVSHISDTPSFANDPRAEEIKKKAKVYEAVKDILQNNIEYIEAWVNKNKQYYSDVITGTEGKSEKDYLISKLLKDELTMTGKQTSLNGYVLNMAKIMASKDDMTAKVHGIESNLANLLRFVQNQDNKLEDMQQAAKAWEESAKDPNKPIPFNNNKNYFSDSTYGMLYRTQAEQELMHTTYNSLQQVASAVLGISASELGDKGGKPTGTPKPNVTGSGNKGGKGKKGTGHKPRTAVYSKNKEVIKKNIEAFKDADIKSNENNIYDHYETDSQPITISYNGTIRQITPHKVWTNTDRQNNIQNSTNAYNILKNIFNLIGTDLSTNKGKEALQTLGVLLKQGSGRIYTLKDLFQLDASDPLANVQLFSQNSNLNGVEDENTGFNYTSIQRGYEALALVRALITNSIEDTEVSTQSKQALRQALGIKDNRKISYAVTGMPRLDFGGRQDTGGYLAQSFMAMGKALHSVGANLRIPTQAGAARAFALGHEYRDKEVYNYEPVYKDENGNVNKGKASRQLQGKNLVTKDDKHKLDLVILFHNPRDFDPTAKAAVEQLTNSESTGNDVKVVNLYNHPELAHLTGDEFIQAIADIVSKQTHENVQNELTPSATNFVNEFYKGLGASDTGDDNNDNNGDKGTGGNGDGKGSNKGDNKGGKPKTPKLTALEELNKLINDYKDKDLSAIPTGTLNRLIKKILKLIENTTGLEGFPDTESKALTIKVLYAYLSKSTNFTGKTAAQSSIYDYLHNQLIPFLITKGAEGALAIAPEAVDLVKLIEPNAFNSTKGQQAEEIIQQDAEDAAGQISNPALTDAIQQAKQEQVNAFTNNKGEPIALNPFELSDKIKEAVKNKDWNQVNKYIRGRVTFLQAAKVDKLEDIYNDEDKVVSKLKDKAKALTADMLRAQQKEINKGPMELNRFVTSPISAYFAFTSDGSLEWAKDINGNSIEESLQQAYVYAMLKAGTRTYNSVTALYIDNADIESLSFEHTTDDDVKLLQGADYGSTHLITTNVLGQTIGNALKSFLPAIYNKNLPDESTNGAIGEMSSSLMSSSRATKKDKDNDSFALNKFNFARGNDIAMGNQGFSITLKMQDGTTNESVAVNLPIKTNKYKDVINDVEKALYLNNSDAFDSLVLTDEEAKDIDSLPVSNHLNHHNEANLTSLQKRAIRADRSQKHVVTSFGEVIAAVAKEVYVKCCSIDNNVYVNQHANEAVTARRKALGREYEYVLDRNQQLKNTDKGLYYNHEMTSVSRMNSRDYLSPRNSKTVRESLSPISYKVPTDDIPRLNLWKRMVVQGLGGKVQNQEDDQILAQLAVLDKAYTKNKDIQAYAKLCNKAALKKGLTPDEEQDLSRLFSKVQQLVEQAISKGNFNEDLHTPLGIHAYTDYFRWKANSKDMISSLYGEADGITNGIFFSKIMDGSLSFIIRNGEITPDIIDEAKTEIDNLARVGFFIGITSSSFYKTAAEQINSALIQDGKVIDTYTQIANEFSNELNSKEGPLSYTGLSKNFGLGKNPDDVPTYYDRTKPKEERVVQGIYSNKTIHNEVTKAFNAVLQALGVEYINNLYKASRIFAKKPTTKSNYQAQEHSIAVELSKQVANLMEQKLNGYPCYILGNEDVISWFDFVTNPDLNLNNIEFENAGDREKLEQDINLYKAVQTLNCFQKSVDIPITEDKKLHINATYDPNAFNPPVLGDGAKNKTTLNVYNDFMQLNNGRFVTNIQVGLINDFKKVIDASLGQEVQSATGDMALASGYICAVYKSMLAKRFKDKLKTLGVVDKLPLSDQPEKAVVQLMHYANKYIPKKEVIQIIKEVLAKSGAITTNRAGTKIFNYKQTLNSQETSDPYVINTTKGKNMFSTEKTREYQDPGVAVAPTSTISIGDGETMNRFIVEVLKPLGISYNDVFDGLNMDPDNHYRVGSQLNKIAAEQALNNSPVELLYHAYKNLRDNIKAEDLDFTDPIHLTPNSESHWDSLNKPRPTDLLGQKDGISDPNSAYTELVKRLGARANRIHKLNQALKSHYVPYSCCQYAFSPESGYTKKAWIKLTEGKETRIHQIKDITDPKLLVEYLNLVGNYVTAEKSEDKQSYKAEIESFLKDNNLLEDYYKYESTADAELALKKEFVRQSNQHESETYIWDGIKNSNYLVKNWLKKMCHKLGVTGKTVLINDPDLANQLVGFFRNKGINMGGIDFTNNAVTVPYNLDGQDIMVILNPYNINFTAHEVTHAMADRIIKDRLEKIDDDTREKIKDWLLDTDESSFKKEPNLPNDSFGDLLRVLKRFITDNRRLYQTDSRYGYTSNLYSIVKEAFAQTVASTTKDQMDIAMHSLKINKDNPRDKSLAEKMSNILSKLKDAFIKFFGLSSDDQYSKIFGNENYSYRKAAMIFFSQMSIENIEAAKNNQENQGKVATISDSVSFANMPESLTLHRLNAFIKQKQQDPKFANLVHAYSFSKPNLGDIATDYATSGITVTEDIPLITTLDTIVKGNYLPPKVRLKINNLYSDFIKSDKLKDLPANKAALITGNILDMFENHKSTTSGLTNFIYLGLTDPDVKSVLKTIKESKLGKFNSNYAVDNWISDRIIETYNKLFLDSNNISKALEAALAKGIASKAVIETLDKVSDAESFVTSKANTVLTTLANKAIDVSGKVIDKASKTINAPKGMQVAATIRTLADVTATHDVDEFAPRAKVLNDINAFLGTGTPHVVQELVRDMVGMDFHNFPVYAMLKKVTATLDRESLQRSKGIPDLLRKKFNNITKEDEAMLAKHYLKLDLTTLLDGSNIYELANTIKDPSNEIAQYEQSLTQYQIRKAKQLANYMVTGKSREMMLRNAHAIAASLHKPLDNTAYKKAMVPQIDKLVSCYAIQQLKPEERNKLAKFIQNNIEGMSALADIHDSIKRSELKKLSNKFNYYKGYIPTSFKNQVNYKAVGSLDAVREARLQGWEFVTKLPKVGLAGETYILRSALPDVNFHKGIIQTNSTKIYGTNERGNSIATLLKPLSKNQYIYNPDNGISDYEPIPTFKSNGAIDSYDRPTPLSDDLFDWSGLDALGKWSANEFIESASKSFNLEVIALTKKVFDEDVKMYGKEADKLYVDINEEAKKDRVVKDAWDRVDPAIKTAIANNFDGKALVRRDMLDLFIGYRSASITDIWTGTSRLPARALNIAARAANMMLGKNAYKYLGHAERAIQHTTASARNFIVVRSVWIPFINATTNIVQLRMRGLTYSEIIKGISNKTAELEHYKIIEKQNIQLKSKLITAKSRQERQKLENRLENNLQRVKTMSIYPMIEAGELSSLADVGDEYNASIFTGKWADKINEEVAKIPEPIVKAGKWLSVSKDTGLYKLMEKATIYGDFIAKSIYFDKLLGDGVKLENAQRMAMEEFVNYDMMAGRSREYLENMGVIWFYNYKLRTAKIFLDIMLHNPASAIFTQLLIPNAILDQGTIVQDNIIGKMASGSLGGTFLPMHFFFSAWNRNPFVALIDKLI